MGTMLSKGWHGSRLGWTYQAYNFGPPTVKIIITTMG